VYLSGSQPQPVKTKSEQRIPEVVPEPVNFLTGGNSDKEILRAKKTHDHPNTSAHSSTAGPTMNYKTKPCRHFESGKCKLSGLCNFAHGAEELNFYQRMARVEDKSLRTIETLTHQRPETSLQKIEKMESFLEHFYTRQKQLLEHLKQLSVSIKPGSLRNEESVSQMETNIVAVYNSAVNYAQEMGRMMDIVKHPAKLPEAVHNVYPEERIETREHDERVKGEAFLDQFHEWDERQLEAVNKQIRFILESLKGLHVSSSEQGKALISAETALKNNQILEASRILQLVLYDKTLDPQTCLAHRRVYERAMTLKFN